MFCKKKKQNMLDSNLVKRQIISWATSQNVDIQIIEILLGDYRDGTENKIEIFVFFRTKEELELYKTNGVVFQMEIKIMQELKEYILDKNSKVCFVYDTCHNRGLYFWSK